MKRLMQRLSKQNGDQGISSSFASVWFYQRNRPEAIENLLLSRYSSQRGLYRCSHLAYAVHSCTNVINSKYFYE